MTIRQPTPIQLWQADAEGVSEGADGGNGADPPPIPEWAQNIEDEGLRTAVSTFKEPDELLKAVGIERPQAPEPKGPWEDIEDEDLQKVAGRFNSKEDALRAIQDFRKRESNVRVPGKDATDDEKAAYLKAVGVPESPDKYEFPEVKEMTEEMKVSRETWAKRFHDLQVPSETAKGLIQSLAEDIQKATKAQEEADKAFVKKQEDDLKSEWKGEEFNKNKELANRAFAEIANRSGLKLDDLTQIETKDGRFLMDRAEIVKLFATIGREMSEGTLGPVVNESEAESIQSEVEGIRKEIETAQEEGNSKKSNKLFQREQALLAKLHGNKPIVGASGRAV